MRRLWTAVKNFFVEDVLDPIDVVWLSLTTLVLLSILWSVLSVGTSMLNASFAESTTCKYCAAGVTHGRQPTKIK